MDTQIMRFGFDVFGFVEPTDPDEPDPEDPQEPVAPFVKKALLVSKSYLNCQNKSAVDSFIISGNEPAGTKRKFMFKFDDKVWKFTSGGTLVEYTGDLTVDNVLAKGNSAGFLNSLSGVASFVGKKIYPIIALSAPSTATDLPTVKIQLNTRTTNDTLTNEVETDSYDLTSEDTPPMIDSIEDDTTCKGSGSVSIRVKLLGADNQWSDYMTLANAANREAFAVQFKFVYSVASVGSDSARVNSITVNHTQGQTVVSGSDADLFSTVGEYEVPLQLCYVIVRHEPLADATIAAQVNFMRPPKHRDFIQITRGSGSAKTVTLPDENIYGASIQLYAEGVPMGDFDFNSATSTVTFTAESEAVINASYDYDRDEEVWRDMTLETTEPHEDGETYMSRFTYLLPDEDATDKTIANVRLKLKRLTGRADESLGSAKGKRQLFTLAHTPKAASIKFDSDDVDFTFDEATQILSLNAPKRTALNVSYKWVGESVVVKSFAAGFSVA